MSFTLETTDMDLGDTPIENIFINDYMPMANGTYVKVYLLGYKYAHDRDPKVELNNQTIGKHLDIPLEDVLRAWDFWEEKGIIEKLSVEEESKINYKVKFLSLKQLYIKNNFNILNPKEEVVTKPLKYDTKDLLDANKIPAINNMFNAIDNIMRRQTVPVEKQKILGWIHEYNMNPDVIEKAFFYSVERKGIRRINYVEAIIRNWYDEGLTNIEAVNESFRTKDEKYYRYQKVMQSLGLHKRPIKEDEMRLIDKWFEEYNFTMEIVLKGCETDKNPTPSINYVNGTLSSWYSKGIKTIEDIETMDRPPARKEFKAKRNTVKKAVATKTRFHNFEQRTDKYSSDELEEIARRKRAAYNQRTKGEV